MANEYYPDCFDPAHVVQEDMQKIETNFEALRTVFSSSSGPASTVPYQFWADSTSHIIKIRDAANASWYNLFDAQNNETQISDTVRKGSIVEGEDIAPASCTLQCGGGGVALTSNFPCSYLGGDTFNRSISTPGAGFQTQPGMEAMVYAYDGQTLRGKVYANASFPNTIKVRFIVGGQTSAESSSFVCQGGTWSPEVELTPVIGIGWQALEWQVDWGSVSSGTISITGHNVNQVSV